MDLSFLWMKFLKSHAKKFGAAFLTMLLGLLLSPAAAPILAILGIGILTFNPDVPQMVELTKGMIVITIKSEVFAAGVAALAVTGVEAARQLLAKHPKSPLPDGAKKAIG